MLITPKYYAIYIKQLAAIEQISSKLLELYTNCNVYSRLVVVTEHYSLITINNMSQLLAVLWYQYLQGLLQ